MSEKVTFAEIMKRIAIGQCIICGSTDVDYGSVDVDGNYTYQHATCLHCDSQWDEATLLGLDDAFDKLIAERMKE